jgi:RNA polymerase sigma-70 factor (ECF subfamily)
LTLKQGGAIFTATTSVLGCSHFSTPRQLGCAVQESEEQLVERAKRDPAAFGLLYEVHVDRIYQYIFYRTGNRQDAEDLTAKTFFRALGKLDTYSYRGLPFSAWLYRIAHNLVANWHRDRHNRQTLTLEEVTLKGKLGDAHHLVEAREREEALRKAIGRLPGDRQQLLILKFAEALSNAEIGKIMGRSEGAVKSLYHRTLVTLREDLHSQGF